MSNTLTVELEADEANAVVYALALELACEAEERLGDAAVTTTPGDLLAIAKSAARIGRLAAVNEQLAWRAHWGQIGGQPPVITASEATLLEIAVALEHVGSQARHAEDDSTPAFAFREAARSIARAFAAAPATSPGLVVVT